MQALYGFVQATCIMAYREATTRMACLRSLPCHGLAQVDCSHAPSVGSHGLPWRELASAPALAPWPALSPRARVAVLTAVTSLQGCRPHGGQLLAACSLHARFTPFNTLTTRCRAVAHTGQCSRTCVLQTRMRPRRQHGALTSTTDNTQSGTLHAAAERGARHRLCMSSS